MTNQMSDNNKRIAKNTLLLYFRMLFMMLVPYVVWKNEEEMR